ncbi:ABC transporter permease [Acinetobacter nosocomialis]|uniref:ABC transporter permease n=1 Tax=Acinetobacter nosocomialis TaxID=106654 RepID=UPI00111E3CDA|nr:ABC transporter permease [Acinetobacter nosocomialis]MDE1701628.1 ABC transporter permease [Acinetobacter nosocomialis]HDG7211448.1 ABC transporter permease [Acinetobacter nosocomialis]
MSSLAQTKPNNQNTFLIKFFRQLRSYPAHLKSYVIAFTSIAFWIAIWQGLAQFKINLGFVNFSNVPTPLDVIHALWAFFQLSAAFEHVESSVFRVVIGFVLAALIGVGIGLLAGRYQKLAALLMPPLEVLRPIPAVAWIPLAILIFPSSEASMIFITFIGALFPILLNTVHGVGAVDPRLVASAKSLGASDLAIIHEVIIPGALPNIITGLSIGMGTCWFCLVTAEMISGQHGIGYFTWESFTLQNYSNIVVGMVLIGALGMFSSTLVRVIGNRFTPWYQLRKS